MAITFNQVVGASRCSCYNVLLMLEAGFPLGDLKIVTQDAITSNVEPGTLTRRETRDTKIDSLSTSSIVLLRNRILYAKAAFNASGAVRFGLRHIRKLLVQLSVQLTDYL